MERTHRLWCEVFWSAHVEAMSWQPTVALVIRTKPKHMKQAQIQDYRNVTYICWAAGPDLFWWDLKNAPVCLVLIFHWQCVLHILCNWPHKSTITYLFIPLILTCSFSTKTSVKYLTVMFRQPGIDISWHDFHRMCVISSKYRVS